MTQEKNRGVTLVEVLIALAVFLILMVPLVSALVSSVKTTDSAKTVQQRNDYAQVIMETVKNAPIENLRNDNPAAGDTVSQYFEGSEGVTVDKTSDHDFTIYGSTYLGTQHDKYSYKVSVEEVRKSDAYGIMENLDPNLVAIVPVTFSNYDDVALEAIVTQDMSEEMSERLDNNSESSDKSRIFNKDVESTTEYVDPRSSKPEKTKKSRDLLKSDTDTTRDKRLGNKSVGRLIMITVTGNSDSGYDVKYELSYVKVPYDKTHGETPVTYNNDGSKAPDTYEKYITYEPYKKHFKTSPNIYVMYNQGVINDYITDDYIYFKLYDDSKGVLKETTFKEDNGGTFDRTERINAFVIRTATDYSTLQSKIAGTTLASELDNLYKDRIKEDYKKSDGTYDDVKIAADVSENGLGSKIISNSKRLYNDTVIDRDNNVYLYEVISRFNQRDHLRVFHNLSTYAVLDANLQRVVCPHCHKSTTKSGGTCDSCRDALVINSKDPENITDDLSKAYEEVWYTYAIKVWLDKGEIDDVKNLSDKRVTLEGTRGGGEIE